jgi:hypothetical protein
MQLDCIKCDLDGSGGWSAMMETFYLVEDCIMYVLIFNNIITRILDSLASNLANKSILAKPFFISTDTNHFCFMLIIDDEKRSKEANKLKKIRFNSW